MSLNSHLAGCQYHIKAGSLSDIGHSASSNCDKRSFTPPKQAKTSQNMKCFIAFALLVVAVAAQNKYTTKYDGIDIDEILKSDRLFNNYYKCLLDQGRCTPDANELKRILPEALQTNCEKCTEKQKDGAVRVINYLIDNRSAQWQVLQKKFDPENVYINQYRNEARAAGIKV